MRTLDCWDDTSAPTAGPRPGETGDRPHLSEVVPARRLETPAGPCYVVRTDYPVYYHYGGRPIFGASAASGTSLATLSRDEEFREASLSRACFLDTETTGLSGGAGTYVFMVGLGYYDGDYFRVDQYFMDDYDEEPALVEALDAALGEFEVLVTFNGKAFDLPLLDTRFILSRKRPPLADRPHLDLLFPSRRLWGLRLESCRLTALEESILGETRVGDIPGHLVPEHFFKYLRTRDPWLVKPVFDHNRQDVLSLAALAGVACELVESYLDDPPPADLCEPLDIYGLARLYHAGGLHEPAARCYRAALDRGLPRAFADRAGLECVRLLRRLGRFSEAAGLCERLADAYPRWMWALVELAKDLEHRLKDYGRALQAVDRALGLLDSAVEPALTESLEWRRARLARKLERTLGTHRHSHQPSAPR